MALERGKRSETIGKKKKNSYSIHRAARLRPSKRLGKHSLHSHVMEDNTPQHSKMPDIVRATDVIKQAWEEPLRRLASVQTSARNVHEQALRDGCVKVLSPRYAARVCELAKGQETREGKRAVEDDAEPGHVCAVEGRVPG